MMGKKRKISTSPIRIKCEVKEERILIPAGNDDVLNARDRLTGALQDLLIQSDDSSLSSNEDALQSEALLRDSGSTSSHVTKNLRQQRKRRRREAVTEGAFHHTYVMKLFDRSVDLAQFQEDTPLYPVCRAWMANQPHNKNLVPKMRTPTPEPPPEELGSGSGGDSDSEIVRDIYKMPPPLPKPEGRDPNVSMRIPSPIPREEEEFNLDYEGKQPISREALLQKHLTRWTAVRRKWYNASRSNEERYAESGRILRAIYKKAQIALNEDMMKQEILT
ncbi:protein lin-37 homolog isoform X2 [Anabrus simplex]|uniref:protein lin-37 homolog isoform X2 n=1 Tax=Anabrus simplex TaxID=316456 RepID=UPI0034DDA48E